MKMRSLLLLTVFFFICLPVFSQDDYNQNTDSVFIIDSFTFNINGITRPDAIIYKAELKKGEEITGLDSLNKYIRDKTQILVNERVLDTVKLDYILGEMREDGKFPVNLIIDIKDTWNIIVLPNPKYSSNTGFEIILKARDYNFLGTMSPLRLDIGYRYDEQGRNSFFLMLDSNTPFRAFGLNWSFKFLNNFDFRPDTEKPFYYGNTTGLSVELPFSFTTITVGFNESINLNEENDDVNKPLYGNFQDGLYMSSNPYISLRIPTGINAGIWGELVYTPEISASFNHEFSKWPLDETRKGPFLEIKNNLGFSRIDWIGNFQRGFDVYIDNSNSFDFNRPNRDGKTLSVNFTTSGTGHFTITDFFGVSARLMYRHWFFHEHSTEAADALRGILDKNIGPDYMLSLNLNLTVRVLRFLPSVWFNNENLRIFNFDLHLSPITDTAFSDNIFYVTGGMEAIFFPEFFRSLLLRVSLGWNLADFSGGRSRELYIGTDLHY